MKYTPRLILSMVLILAGATLNGCALPRAVGKTAGGIVKGTGKVVSGTAKGAGKVVSGTAKAVTKPLR